MKICTLACDYFVVAAATFKPLKSLKQNSNVFQFLRECHMTDAVTSLKCLHLRGKMFKQTLELWLSPHRLSYPASVSICRMTPLEPISNRAEAEVPFHNGMAVY